MTLIISRLIYPVNIRRAGGDEDIVKRKENGKLQNSIG